MKVAVLPGSTKTAQAAIRSLLADPSSPDVVAFYRDPARAPSEFTTNARFEAVRGDLMDAATLDLTGCDAVLAITPPTFEDVDLIERARKMSQNTRDAVRRASKTVKRLVLLSSQGAEFDHGVGEIGTNHVAEVTLKDAAPEVVFVRCAYFMENWMMALQTLRSKSPFFYSTLTPLNHILPMVSVKDIGDTLCAQLLSAGSELASNPHIFDLEGPDAYSSLDVQKAFEKALGKSVDVKPVEKEDLEAYWSKAFPSRVAKYFTEMTISTLPGGLLADSWEPGRTINVQRGETSLDEAIRRLCAEVP